MKFHLISLGDYVPDPITGRHNQTQAERFQTIVKQGVLAEELGFSGFWVGEHHSNDYIVSNPQMILSAVASQTERIRLGSAISLLANNDPVRLAEDFATLDLISNGRAEIGFGAGITPSAYRIFGQNPEFAAEISAENLNLIQQLWNNEYVTWKGDHRGPLDNFRLEPRTFTSKSLPIMRAAGHSEGPVREAAADGHKLSLLTVATGFEGARPLADLYRKLWVEAGRDLKDSNLSVAIFSYCRPDGAAAQKYWSNYILNYKNVGQAVRDKQGWSESLEAIATLLGDKARDKATQTWMAGDPAETIDRIHQAYEDVGGFNELNILFDVGGLPAEEVYKSMRVFAEDVAPHLNMKSAE